MGITTSDEIRKQLTVILGAKTGLIKPEMEIGDIIGIGKLSKTYTEALISQTLQYIQGYNAILRDYADCELDSIEFELENMDKVGDQLQILPKSMLFIPGEYKDCNTLMLLLAPEMSLLDHHHAKDAVVDLGKLYFEVEEAIDRPELPDQVKRSILNTFAHRFALKLQGNVIDGKWNRKLVGLKTDSEEKFYEKYLSVQMKKNIRWNLNNLLEGSQLVFQTPNLSYSESDKMEFLKYRILPSTARIITQHSFRLTANLLQIANTGSIDDNQKRILILILNTFLKYLENQPLSQTVFEYKTNFINFLQAIWEKISLFQIKVDEFCKSGFVGPLADAIEKSLEAFPNGNTLDEYFFHHLAKISTEQFKTGNYDSAQRVRVNEFKVQYFYIIENTKLILKTLNNTGKRFYDYIFMILYSQKLLDLLYKEFEQQQKPIKALGYKYLEKFAQYLKDKIEFKYRFHEYSEIDVGKLSSNSEAYSRSVFEDFIGIAKIQLEDFIKDVSIEIEDLMGFVEILHKSDALLLPHIENLAKFRGEIEFLWGMILRASSINRFLKEYPENSIFDPEQFSIYFGEFLRKRIGGFQLNWGDYVISWLTEFKEKLQPRYILDARENIKWSKERVIQEFITFFEDKVKTETDLIGFKAPLKFYVDQVSMDVRFRNVKLISDSYEMSIDLIQQVPDYIRQVFLKVIENFAPLSQKFAIHDLIGKIPNLETIFTTDSGDISFINPDSLSKPKQMDRSKDSYQKVQDIFQYISIYDYVLNSEVKYFSNLLAKPKTIYLKTLDKEFFQGKTLVHKIEFQYWSQFMKTHFYSNFKEVKPRF